jgi:hypothetical protein
VEGITLPILSEALAAARAGREHVLREMGRCSPPPRRALAPFAPRVIRFQVRLNEVKEGSQLKLGRLIYSLVASIPVCPSLGQPVASGEQSTAARS